MPNPILDQTDGSKSVQFSTLWKSMAALSFAMLASIFVGLLTWGVWVTVTVNEHGQQIARLDERSNNRSGVSQSVNVGSADSIANEDECESARTWLTTQEVAAREGITDRTVINYIAQKMIDPPPVQMGKAWHIAENYRIIPNNSEKCGNNE